jgi:hypothetical protein
LEQTVWTFSSPPQHLRSRFGAPGEVAEEKTGDLTSPRSFFLLVEPAALGPGQRPLAYFSSKVVK